MLGPQDLRRQLFSLSYAIFSFKNCVKQGSRVTVGTLQKHLGRNQQLRFKSSHVLKIGENRQIAYRQMPGQSQPTIVMVPGFHSYAHMNGMTAKSILR